MTLTFAPPCSGPARVPTALVTALYMSVRVATVTRAANVEAFSSWSAWRIRATSRAWASVSLGSLPVSWYRKLAAVDRPGLGAIGSSPLRRRSRAATIVPIWAVTRRALRLLASMLSSPSSGSYRASSEVAVRRASIAVAVLGNCRSRARAAPGGRGSSSRSAFSASNSFRGRQIAVPQQINDLFKGRVLGQVVDVIAPVDQFAVLAVHVTDGRLAGDHVFQAFCEFFIVCHVFPHRRSKTAFLARACAVSHSTQFFGRFSSRCPCLHLLIVRRRQSVRRAGSSSHLPATDILVPQQAHVPTIARRPFFISVRVAESISCLARQRTQYPCKVTS